MLTVRGMNSDGGNQHVYWDYTGVKKTWLGFKANITTQRVMGQEIGSISIMDNLQANYWRE